MNRIIGPPPPPDNAYVTVDIGFVDFLWVPDIYIYHLKTIKVLNIFTQFAGKNRYKLYLLLIITVY